MIATGIGDRSRSAGAGTPERASPARTVRSAPFGSGPIDRTGTRQHQFRTKGQLAIDICADARADGLGSDFICGEGQLVTKTRLIQAAGLRWPIEEGFEFGKDCFGLDECQARLFTAILRHTVLVMATA